MKALQWMQVATFASTFALAGVVVACDTDQTSSEEHTPAAAAVNSNSPAELGTGLTSNSAAQMGAEAPKTTVPSESDSAAPDADGAISNQPM